MNTEIKVTLKPEFVEKIKKDKILKQKIGLLLNVSFDSVQRYLKTNDSKLTENFNVFNLVREHYKLDLDEIIIY